MHNTKSHTKTLKRAVSKSKNRFIAYNDTQFAYVKILEADTEIDDILPNYKLSGFSLGENYSTDFLCKKIDNTMTAIETIEKRVLLKPQNLKLLEASRHYWLARGVEWKLVVGEKTNEQK